ncbi:MAG: TIGR04283 family arsenosugar biosynthesis glycosyltransferase [Syntrophomonas sp.]
MGEAQISVIIPTLNEEAALPGLLQFLSGQADVQVIVSDGGSSDKTLNIGREYGANIVGGPPGRGGQLIRGAAEASAPIMLFLHADSRIERSLLDELMQAVKDGARWGCAVLEFDKEDLFYKVLAQFSNLRSRLFNSCYGDQAIYCCSDFYEQIGGYPDWPFLEDIEVSRRARLLKRARIISAKVTTSTRRFEERGRLRTLLGMQWIKLRYACGASPQKLSVLYQDKRGLKC